MIRENVLAKYRRITFSLMIRPLFTPPLPSNPTYMQTGYYVVLHVSTLQVALNSVSNSLKVGRSSAFDDQHLFISA